MQKVCWFDDSLLAFSPCKLPSFDLQQLECSEHGLDSSIGTERKIVRACMVRALRRRRRWRRSRMSHRHDVRQQRIASEECSTSKLDSRVHIGTTDLILYFFWVIREGCDGEEEDEEEHLCAIPRQQQLPPLSTGDFLSFLSVFFIFFYSRIESSIVDFACFCFFSLLFFVCILWNVFWIFLCLWA
jgi:hypothetical protein